MGIIIKFVSSGSRHAAGRKGSSKNRKKKSGLGGVITLVLVALVLVGTFVGFGLAAKGRDTIYPNVSVAGIQVGGMTVEEATAALQGAGLDNYGGKAVTVEFTNSLSVQITSEAAGVRLQLDQAAEDAFAHGRSGGFIGNTLKYIRSLFGETELPLGAAFSIDEAYIRGQISQAAVALLTGSDDAYTLGENKLTLVKASNGLSIDENAVYQKIYDAFAKQDYSTIQFEPESAAGADGLNLQTLHDSIFKEVSEAYYDKESDSIVPSVTGISFDVKQAQALYDAAGIGDTVQIDLILTEPEVSTEYLESILFRDLLASKTTSLTSSVGRSKNIELAAAEVNETVLMPGEIFDYNDVVGERTTARGFSAAAAYRGKETVQEVGGGICQVSSTIYYATLYARLDTVYRTCHRYASSYVPLGMDATVSWGGPEFRFKNSSEHPIKILAYINWNGDYRQSVTVEIYGTKWDDRYVEMSYTYTGSVPFETEYVDDPDLPLGEEVVEEEGYVGTKVDTYRSVYEADGTLAYTEFIDSSAYYGGDEIIRRGTGENVSPDPNDPTVSPNPDDPNAPPTESPDPSDPGTEPDPSLPEDPGTPDTPDTPGTEPDPVTP